MFCDSVLPRVADQVWCYNPFMDNNRSIIRVSHLQDQGTEDDLRNTTAEERWGMMWQLAVDAWAFKGEQVDESSFRRDVVRVIRGGR